MEEEGTSEGWRCGGQGKEGREGGWLELKGSRGVEARAGG